MRSQYRARIVLVGCACATFLCVSTVLATDPATEVELRENVVYGEAGGEKLTLHLARPKQADGPLPAVLFLHRGGWVGGSKDRYKHVIQDFAREGYIAVSVGYRFAPKHKFPAQVEDAKCAVRWLRAHASELGVDPQRIGALGESAGAHLSMMLGTLDPSDGMEGDGGWADQPSKVQAVVSFYGPTDLRWNAFALGEKLQGIHRNVAKRLLTAFVGGPPEENEETLHKASPIKYVGPGDAPTLLIQGTADPLVLPEQAQVMVDALTKAGVEGRADLEFGKGHDWDGDDFYKPLARARLFLDEHLKSDATAQAANAADRTAWNKTLAAKYLDDRANEWLAWPRAERSQDTHCLSCHTSYGYLTARRALNRSLGVNAKVEPLERQMADIRKRVEHWSEITPWYDSSPEKATESRGTEAVLNAFALSVGDAESAAFAPGAATKQALATMWAEQRSEGDRKGSWAWLDFELEPWESASAEYWGAALAAIAVGVAPGNYEQKPEIAENVKALREYLRAGLSNGKMNLHARVMLLLASLRLDGLLDSAEQEAIANEIMAAQRPDGGWSLSDLGEWKVEHSASDGYATGVCSYVLLQVWDAQCAKAGMNGCRWLRTHQDPQTGAWPTPSVNKERDPNSFVGKFTQDTATAFAVFALSASE